MIKALPFFGFAVFDEESALQQNLALVHLVYVVEILPDVVPVGNVNIFENRIKGKIIIAVLIHIY